MSTSADGTVRMDDAPGLTASCGHRVTYFVADWDDPFRAEKMAEVTGRPCQECRRAGAERERARAMAEAKVRRAEKMEARRAAQVERWEAVRDVKVMPGEKTIGPGRRIIAEAELRIGPFIVRGVTLWRRPDGTIAVSYPDRPKMMPCAGCRCDVPVTARYCCVCGTEVPFVEFPRGANGSRRIYHSYIFPASAADRAAVDGLILAAYRAAVEQEGGIAS